MLRSLYINNIAIISRLNAEFFSGMTSLTGETGAGKSIVIDALTLALGKRAEKNLLKHDSGKAEVIAEFDLSDHPGVQAWLQEQELDSTECECVLRRNLYPDRPSRSFINGRPVTAHILNELGEQLVIICGQQEHLNLVNPAYRLDIIDGQAKLEKQLAELGSIFRELAELTSRIDEIERTESQGADQAGMLELLITELEQENPNEEDYLQLDQEQKRLAHAIDIAKAVNLAQELLDSTEQPNVLGLLDQLLGQLTAASKYDSRLDPVIRDLSESSIVCNEAANELSTIADKLDFEPERQYEVEQRLAIYHQLARKHRCEPAFLGKKLVSLRKQLETYKNRDSILAELKSSHEKALIRYHLLAQKISRLRARSSAVLSKTITRHLRAMNLPQAICRFECNTDTGRVSSNGQDNIRILVSTNSGQPPGPVEKIASGGELSRISLAIQLEAGGLASTPVLVFDEVDAGISGQTANLVGIKLRELGYSRQVICITHLPQVASKANHQLKVSKLAGKYPKISLQYLDNEARVEELARILSGHKITDESLANARVLLQDSA